MKRSKFSLSNYKLLTCDMGQLIPINCFEALPGDSIQQATSLLARVSPLLAPVMHPVRMRIHHWFVPNRLIWDEWEDFITGGPDGYNASVVPQMSADVVEKSLGDYLGLPPMGALSGAYSALPFRAYQLIYNEFYRDQDLQPEAVISTASGTDTTTDRSIQHACWEKDYFTSARPWSQKGPDVSLPLQAQATITGNGVPTFRQAAGPVGQLVASTQQEVLTKLIPPANGADLQWDDPKLLVDLQNATAVNVIELRRAFALQRYEEARARYGSRYTEYLRYLGVRSSDARLQRPEYLGGGKQTIQFSEVLQTGPGTDDEGVANLKGHGIGAMRSNRYRRFFEEHGIVLSLLSVLPKTIYAQGVNRMWTRNNKEDYFQKELQHIGQQEVLNREIYGQHTQPFGIFGYQDRYDEYRRIVSSVAGEFQSTLDFWHYARIFAAQPTLNGDFVKAVPTKRVNAEQTQNALWIMANHSIQARRMVAGKASSSIF